MIHPPIYAPKRGQTRHLQGKLTPGLEVDRIAPNALVCKVGPKALPRLEVKTLHL